MNIAILTSGGDAPGMNRVIETLSKRANIAFLEGVKGLYEIIELPTFISFHAFDIEVQDKIINNLKDIDYLVVIGGNGSLEFTNLLIKRGVKALFIPATIDNDIPNMESIGFDSALNSAIEAIDKISDSALSHNRIFLVEVMGNKSSAIAKALSLATGYRCINDDIEIEHIENSSEILIIPESLKALNRYSKVLSSKMSKEVKIISLGHIQRGGAPTARDRILAAKYANKALENISTNSLGIVKI